VREERGDLRRTSTLPDVIDVNFLEHLPRQRKPRL
jgi:hypothetical protein